MNTVIYALIIDPTRPDLTDLADVRTINTDLASLQRLVGGPIERFDGYRTADGTLTGTPRICFYSNEESKIRDLAINWLATDLWWHYNPYAKGIDVLGGPVVITGYQPATATDCGYDTHVPDDVLQHYLTVATQPDTR